MLKLNTTVSRIQGIYEQTKSITSDGSNVQQFLLAAADVDTLWQTFLVENEALLDALLELSSEDEYFPDQEGQIRSMVLAIKTAAIDLSSVESSAPPALSAHDSTPSTVVGPLVSSEQ